MRWKRWGKRWRQKWEQGAGEQWRRFTSFIRSTPEMWGQVVGSMGEVWEGFLGRIAEVWEQVSDFEVVLQHTCSVRKKYLVYMITIK